MLPYPQCKPKSNQLSKNATVHGTATFGPVLTGWYFSNVSFYWCLVCLLFVSICGIYTYLLHFRSDVSYAFYVGMQMEISILLNLVHHFFHFWKGLMYGNTVLTLFLSIHQLSENMQTEIFISQSPSVFIDTITTKKLHARFL